MADAQDPPAAPDNAGANAPPDQAAPEKTSPNQSLDGVSPEELLAEEEEPKAPTADESEAADGKKKSVRDWLTIPRSATPYFVAALLAATAMAWYFFVFVPAKLEYFVGLRLRTLAVASGQIKSKAESLGLSLYGATIAAETVPPAKDKPEDKSETFVQTYLRLLVPEIQLSAKGPPASAGGLELAIGPPTADGRAVTPKQEVKADDAAAGEIKIAESPPGGTKPAETNSDETKPVVTATVPWDRVTAQGGAASTADFDDLVLADEQGVVVWQREKTTPRLGTISEVLHADEDKGTWLTRSWAIPTVLPVLDPAKKLPKTAALKPVRIGANSTLILVQAIQLDSPYVALQKHKTLYVAGFVTRSRLHQQAMQIPLVWVVAVSLPIVVLFLALPFIKLATMNTKERFSAVNLLLMAVGVILAAGLAAVVPIGPRSESEAGDRALKEIATQVENHLKEETQAVLRLAQTVTALGDVPTTLASCVVPITVGLRGGELCDLWGLWDALKVDPRTKDTFVHNAAFADVELDIASWVDDRGEQLQKWTTKAQLTGEASHRDYDHFRTLTAGSLWKLKGDAADTYPPFTIEPLRAPTTADIGVVFGMRLDDLRASKGPQVPKAGEPPNAEEPPKSEEQRQSEERRPVDAATRLKREARFLVLNVRPHALVDVVMPPGYGFAVVASDGRVLFHSNDGLSLHENFFDEVSDAQNVRDRLAEGHAATWSGDYHGTPHRIRMHPLTVFAECPWKIVTFQDLAPGLGAIVEHHSGTFRLTALNLALLLIALGIGAWWYKTHHGSLRDLIGLGISPAPRRLYPLPVLITLGAVALVATDDPRAHLWADRLFLWFVLLPFFALAVSLYARRRPAANTEPAPSWPAPLKQLAGRFAPVGAKLAPALATLDTAMLKLELIMVVLVVGALPVAGFARVVERVQNAQAMERWLEVAHQRVATHEARIRARAVSPAYVGETRVKLRKSPLFLGSDTPSTRHSYVSGSGVLSPPGQSCRTPSGSNQALVPSASGQGFVRFLLAWTIFATDRHENADITACPASNLLYASGEGLTLVGKAWPDANDRRAARSGSVGLNIGLERPLIAIAIFVATILAVNWARRRLTTQEAPHGLSFSAALSLLAKDGNQGILLVGPPRMRKDQWIRTNVASYAEFKDLQPGDDPILRIKLLDRKVDAKLLTNVLAELARRAQEEHKRLRDAKGRVWIHISNLEAHLTTPKDRTAVLKLLEVLLDRSKDEPSRIIVITTCVDPIAHFREIFTTERERIYKDGVPEVQLSRSSLLLSRFRRCYLPIRASHDDNPWNHYEPAKWKHVLRWEAARYPPLVDVAKAVKSSHDEGATIEVPRAALAEAFRSQALATYDLLWASCTRCEKIVLIQLAQEGFVTTRNCEVVWSLINKGLIVERPRPAIFNDSFRQFLRSIERDHVVEAWEREDGHGLWLVAGRLVGSSLIAGGLFFLVTQDFPVSGLIPIVSGTGLFGVPALKALLEKVTTRGPGGGVMS